MADWNSPLTTSNYTDVISELKGRDESSALMFDGTTDSNLPVGTIRWNSSSNKFQKWDGSTWVNETGRLDVTDTLSSLTSAEATQLTNINSVTISNVQWSYLGDFNQSLTTSSSVSFGSLSISGNASITGQLTLSGLLDASGQSIRCEKLRLENLEASDLSTDGEIIYDTSDGIYYQRGGSVALIWDSGNDGPGTGLNADLLDNQHGAYYNDTPNETRSVFYQASAPTGWTQVTSVNDRVLRVVSGTGGGTGGDWQISGLGKGSLSVGGHTLTLSQLPNVTGYFRLTGGQGVGNSVDPRAGTSGVFSNGGRSEHGNSFSDSGTNSEYGQVNFNLGGGGQSHDHPLSGSPNHDGSWRPEHINVIVCQRNK